MFDKIKGEEGSEVGFPFLPTGPPEPGRGSPWWVGTGKTLSHLGPSWVLAPDGLSVTPAWQSGAARDSGRHSCSVPGICRFLRNHQASLPPDKGQLDRAGHRMALWSRPGTTMEGQDRSDILGAQSRITHMREPHQTCPRSPRTVQSS